MAAYDDLVARARDNKLAVADFEGTTISLTNPGTVGTVGSIPRLMPGQGAIIATGAIDYPPEYRGVPEDVRTSLGLEQGDDGDLHLRSSRDSGRGIGRVPGAAAGAARRRRRFLRQIFRDLGIPARPVRWEPDQATAPMVNADPVKQAGVARLIQAWRERGHLVADLDPLGSTRPPHPDLEPSAHGLTIWDLDRTFHAGSFGVTTLRTSARPAARYLRGQDGRAVHAHRQSGGAELAPSSAWSRRRTSGRWSRRRRRRILKDIVEPRDSRCSWTTASRGTSAFRSKAAKR